MGWTCWLLGHSKNYEDGITRVDDGQFDDYVYQDWKCLRCGKTGKDYLGVGSMYKAPHQ